MAGCCAWLVVCGVLLLARGLCVGFSGWVSFGWVCAIYDCGLVVLGGVLGVCLVELGLGGFGGWLGFRSLVGVGEFWSFRFLG